VSDFKQRLDRLQAELDEPFLVTTPVNVRYLCGLDSSNAALLVSADRARLFSDFRYAEAARAVDGVEFTEVERAIFVGVRPHLDGRVGFEAGHVTYANWEALRESAAELVPTTGVVERLRAVKDDAELGAIRHASEITSQAYLQLAEERFVGRTERELAWRMDTFMHELGADGPAFPTIVAGGRNSATPHAHAGNRPLEAGETVIVDAGARVDGYASDCTRTFATGELEPELRRAYDVCLEAQRAGVEAVAPGAAGREVDTVARGLIAEAGFGDAFGHGLGHGVGLLVHEAPVLRPESDDFLQPGNVVTVEPGIYLSGRGGIRIEDLVLVTAQGRETLTGFTKELVTVS
jgi:Xaa-Pro aminopeptidase